MTLVIVAAKGGGIYRKKYYCLLQFMFDDVFLKRDGRQENTHTLDLFHENPFKLLQSQLATRMKFYNPIKTGILHMTIQGNKIFQGIVYLFKSNVKQGLS